MRIRVSRTVLGWLEGTQAWHDIGRPPEEQRDDPEVIRLFAELDATGRRSDGSVELELDLERALILREYGEYMELAARDGAGYDTTERAELNAARGLIRQIDRKRGW